VNTNQDREAVRKRLESKEHREAFVSATVDQTIPFQIRALRLAKERNWTQEELAQRASMKQERISACENPNYGKFSLRTLKQLASAFDVALIVRFAPFSELTEWEVNMSPESLEVPSFDQENDFKEKIEGDFAPELLETLYSEGKGQPEAKSDIVLKIVDYHQKRQYGIEKEPSEPIEQMEMGG
jgi:transcriptional regulator with XRE-family HTH domain